MKRGEKYFDLSQSIKQNKPYPTPLDFKCSALSKIRSIRLIGIIEKSLYRQLKAVDICLDIILSVHIYKIKIQTIDYNYLYQKQI